MTIAENLDRLVTAKNDIATSIAGKGVTVAETDGFEEYPALIDSIQAGGSGTATPADVRKGKTFTSASGVDIEGTMNSYTEARVVVNNPSKENIETFKRFVSVGSADKSYYSTNGTTWTTMNVNSNYRYYRLMGVAYGNERFVCAGVNDSYEMFKYSTDGTVWTALPSTYTSAYYTDIIYANGKFVCSGTKGKYSTDGITWTNAQASWQQSAVTYGDGKFVSVGSSGKSFYSIDGITWTAMSMYAGDTYNLYGVAYGNDKFICVGDNWGGTYILEKNSTSWNSGASIVSKNIKFNNIIYGKDRFIAANINRETYYSKDGANWTAMSGISLSVGTNDTKCGLTYGNGKYICAVGYTYYSTNGTSWTAIPTQTSGVDAVCAGSDIDEYLSYTLPAGYHSSQKILLKK